MLQESSSRMRKCDEDRRKTILLLTVYISKRRREQKLLNNNEQGRCENGLFIATEMKAFVKQRGGVVGEPTISRLIFYASENGRPGEKGGVDLSESALTSLSSIDPVEHLVVQNKTQNFLLSSQEAKDQSRDRLTNPHPVSSTAIHAVK
ncbi:hypothetical protein NPIL_137921 [Nephila pilipes]|uniref:Uncharacterized protein n=1 Tax=Nephila pilipes TaxID=299642 RepID=A0A8X6PZC2_NEPPI|nr:hypothetical protein NPIL_137921 [Nephila pilipes]